MPKMIEITAAEYERLQDCIREDGMRIAALIEENKALHQGAKHLNAYGLYCQLCETLTGEINPEPGELRDAIQKAKRDLEAYKGAGQRYEAEIARLKEMAAEDILLAARHECPCESCINNTLGDGCNFGECENCEHQCTCYECHDHESFVWRGGK